MRVLYKLPERIFTAIFFAFILSFAALQTNLYPQNPPLKSADWTLPFKPCGALISAQTKTKQIASDNEKSIYILSSNGTVESFDLPEKKNNWTSDLGAEIISNIALDNKNLYIASKPVSAGEAPKLWAISKLTGITSWQKEIKKTDKIYLEIREKKLYVLSNDYFLSVDAEEENAPVGTYDSEFPSNPGRRPAKAFLRDSSHSFSKEIELFLNNHENILENISGIAENTGILVAGSRSGDLKAFHKQSGKELWSGKVGGEIASIVFFEEKSIIVGSLDNFLYLFSAADGRLIWKRRLPHRLTEKPLIRDKIALIANAGSGSAFIIDLEKGKVLNRISLPESVYFNGNSLLEGNKIIIPTNSGIFLYSREPC